MRGLHPLRDERDEAPRGKANMAPEDPLAAKGHGRNAHRTRHTASPERDRGSREDSRSRSHKKRSRGASRKPSDGEAEGDGKAEGSWRLSHPHHLYMAVAVIPNSLYRCNQSDVIQTLTQC